MKIKVNDMLTGRRTRGVVTVVKSTRSEHGAESRDGVQD